jgi:undecaprenyl-diphosphatase
MHEFIIIVAKYFVILSIIGVAIATVALSTSQRLKFFGVVAIGGVITLLLARLSSHFYHDPRPFVVGKFVPLIPHGNDNGFPSDHTLISAFLAYATLYFSKKIGWTLVSIAVLIGISRVAAGVHHFTDIIGSFVIAGLGCWIAILLVNRLTKKSLSPTTN